MKNVNVKITELESKSDAYHKHFTFHSRAASAENCQELRSHGFSSSGHFLLIRMDGILENQLSKSIATLIKT